jgi:hypothetical protein
MSEGDVDVNLEEMAQAYSKKWGVSVEEARKKIMKVMEEKPVDRAAVLPTEDFPFPEPIGPVSKKVQDMSQAALSSAYTTSKLRELSQPPKQLEAIQAQLDSVTQTMNATLELVNTKVKTLQETLDAKTAAEERAKLIGELETKIIAPIKNDLETVKKSIEAKDQTGATASMRDLADRLKTAEADAVKVLQELGYPVPEKRVTSAAPPTPATPGQMDIQATIEFLKRQGYRVESDVMTKDEAKKMIEEATKKAQEEALDNERIKAVENIIRESISKMIELFRVPVESYFKMAFERQASGEPAAAE